MYWLRFLGVRCGSMAVTACAIVVIAFTLMFFSPGGIYAQALQRASEQAPNLLQLYWHGVTDALMHMITFQFGIPSSLLDNAFTVSLTLSLGSIVLAALLGIPLGVWAATQRNSVVDYLMSAVSIVSTIPPYVMGSVLMLVFCVTWPILPAVGWSGPQNALLPIVTLSTVNLAYMIKYTRSGMIDTLKQDFVYVLRAKGVSERTIVFRHSLRPGLSALLTIMGPQTAWTITNTAVIENMYAIPGLGVLLGNSLPSGGVGGTATNWPLALTSVFLLCLIVLLLNFLVDLCYSLIDPRVRY